MFSWRSRKGEKETKWRRKNMKGRERKSERAREGIPKAMVFWIIWKVISCRIPNRLDYITFRTLVFLDSCPDFYFKFLLPFFFAPHCYSNHDLIPNRGSLGHQCCNREWEGGRQMDSQEVEREGEKEGKEGRGERESVVIHAMISSLISLTPFSSLSNLWTSIRFQNQDLFLLVVKSLHSISSQTWDFGH